MTDLRVHEAVDRPAGHDQAQSDAGSDREIGAYASIHGGTPARLRQRRCGDVGVERDRYAGGCEVIDDARIRPAWLGRRRDSAGSQVERSEAADAERGGDPEVLPFPQRRAAGGKRLGRRRRRDPPLLQYLASTRDQHDGFAAADFDSGDQAIHARAPSRPSRNSGAGVPPKPARPGPIWSTKLVTRKSFNTSQL